VIFRFTIGNVGGIYLLSGLRHAHHHLLGAKRFGRGTRTLHQAHEELGIVVVDRCRILLQSATTLDHSLMTLGKKIL
jgi:hypothetical protein